MNTTVTYTQFPLASLPTDILFKIVQEFIQGKEYYYNKYTNQYHVRFCKKNEVYTAIQKLYVDSKAIWNKSKNKLTIQYGERDWLNLSGNRRQFAVIHTSRVENDKIVIETNCYKYMLSRDDDEDFMEYMEYEIIYHRKVIGRYNKPNK